MRTSWQRAEVLFSLGVAAVLAGALWMTFGMHPRAALFPWVVIVPSLALVLWQLVDDVRGKTAPPTMEPSPVGAAESTLAAPPADAVRRQLAFLGWILALLAAIWLLGFTVGGAVAVLLMLRFGFGESWRLGLAYAVCTYLALEIIFRQLLLVPLFPGLVFDWLQFDIIIPLDARLRP